MVIKTVQTLVFEYPEDYQAEVEWNKKRDGDWVHQSTDTICSVYTLTNNYLIPTKAKHSFVDNPYFEVEPQTERKCSNCKFLTYRFNKVWCDIKADNPHDKVCDRYKPKDEPQTEYDKYREKIKAHDPHKYGFEDEPQTDCAWGKCE